MQDKTIIISTLAEYQTKFWIKVAKNLKDKGNNIIFLSFDDRSSSLLIDANFEQFNVPSLAKKSKSSSARKYKIFNKLDINKWTLHEKITFNIRNSDLLNKKLMSYLNCIDDLIKEIKSHNSNLIMLQELGGFTSVIGAYFASLENDVDNYFIEPSFFKGRLFFTKNSFDAPDIGSHVSESISLNVDEYLKKVLKNHEIVIPKKDRHQYAPSLSKILNVNKFKRLIGKLSDKYLFSKHQEFSYINQYVKIHIIAAINSFLLRKSYTNLSSMDKFIYFPLHVPGDAALTIRSTEYLDQITLIEYLSSRIPSEYKLAIKEHPAQIGATNRIRLKKALKQFDNIVLISPEINNYEVISKAKFLITINSKSGAEALLLNKHVIVLGDAFYKDSPLVHKVEKINEVEKAITLALNAEDYTNDHIYGYFQTVWNKTYDGELYVDNSRDIETIALSINNNLFS
jgi:hypothetical protein